MKSIYYTLLIRPSRFLRLCALLVPVFFLAACTDHFEDLNKNPAGFPTISPGVQLTKIQADLSGNREDVWRYDLAISSPLIQHLAGSWWTQHGGQYRILDKGQWYTLWETTYPRDLKNVQDLVERTTGDPALVNINSAARIMRVYIYSRLTDVYGDIPYSQAIKGYTEKIFLPKYDSQEEIYTNFFKELDEAVKVMDPTKGNVQGDVFYDGNVDKWIKFGNSLRLRLGFRLTKIKPELARQQVEAAIAGGVMGSNMYSCVMRHEPINFTIGDNRGNGRSQVFQADVSSSGFRLTNTLVDYMKATKDPRLTIYGGTYLPVNGSEAIDNSNNLDITPYLQEGLAYGAMSWNVWMPDQTITLASGDKVVVPTAYRRMQPSKYVAALNAPFFHLTYAEVELLLAEAAARGWGGQTDAEGHFMKAIQAACESMSSYPNAPTISQAAIDELKGSFTPFPTAFDDQMEAIHGQMWVNFFLNGTEAYANYRRTGYPKLVPFTSVDWYTSGTNGVMPRRFFYPESEAVQNPTNYTDAVGRLGGQDDWLKRVWWDKEE
ncbi:SusD/RagB family nutrient-binding outer membrane lipoprotein [Cytophagaceae bacterium YF14B1]|uniref:SusD/RagB family nutrient-binding outer membrane lipoprotein n=1 Tax=Xanthocytophaga flava TaxID=3048013 RepID=A0AAE3QNK8_9BACT|nr:SusD/RagB family nutrient-binding outer membrane lipoprotein [Xanthocytophaga flavus]MDJ1482652.1 SusD/RagB family nutrient-binding outer membrane lipoprotein [Xanthocytophaga flavus]